MSLLKLQANKWPPNIKESMVTNTSYTANSLFSMSEENLRQKGTG